ncbi:c-type cytochrome [Alloalcanivorax xenomutans]|uniref:c-type cytochrome n=1 Tax=Alloalcanivorax xenomutans TaxID=1094342 RepID=UPI003BAD5CEF
MTFTGIKPCVKCIAVLAIMAGIGGTLFLYSGWYPMGADDPHNRLTYWVLETLRERSIARASADIEVPDDLASPQRLLAGGADYNDMCAGCHLKPGRESSDFTLGLYPSPPNLTQLHHKEDNADTRARRRFWIIKHGIKASGMPAWAPGHDDERIWNMVAFLEQLPELSSEQFQILAARGENDSGHHSR